jgi:DNA-binding response OmpR family regulator
LLASPDFARVFNGILRICRMKKILLIEDDPDIQDLVRYSLGLEGFAVETCSDGIAGLLAARKVRPDLILLDVMLPGLTGNEVCKKLKADRSTEPIPIIFLTARSDEIDKMIGFEIGADDYVSKPFSPRELAARIKAVLRRAQAPPFAEGVLSFGDLRVDFEKRQVLFRQAPVVLSALEFSIFYLLASAPNRVFTRDEVLDRVWKGESFVNLRTVDVHIRRLRSKIEQVPQFPPCISTLRGVGYKFEWPS